MRVEAGQSMPGRAPGMAMEVASSGTSDLNVLVMFVVDATKPLSTSLPSDRPRALLSRRGDGQN